MLADLQDRTQQVLRYRKQALSNAADNMDSIASDEHAEFQCTAAREAFQQLHRLFVEARVLAIGGLEVLRMGVQDISCQVCFACDPSRSLQVARVLYRDLAAVMGRLQALRKALPAWESCLPWHWSLLGGTLFSTDVSVRAGDLRTFQHWVESIAVALTALAGEFNALAYTLCFDQGSIAHTESVATIEADVREVPVPIVPAERRAALLIEGCAELSYPKVDIITAGREDCAKIWRKFPYAAPATSVMLPAAFARAATEAGRLPSEGMLEFLRGAAELSRHTPAQFPNGLLPAPALPAFDPQALSSRAAEPKRALVFLCKHTTFCGGHGDRLFGLLSAYLAAELTGRQFFIDMQSPIPLAGLLAPRVPWPAVTDACAVYRWTSAENLTALDDDIARLLADDRPVVCVASNVRLFRALLRRDQSGDFTRAGLLSGLFGNLFKLAPGPSELLTAFSRGLAGRRLLGIHFRAGNESAWNDPARHSLGDVAQALACAAGVEQLLGLPSDTAWLLAADSPRIRAEPAVVPLYNAGKIVYLESRLTHIDRSQPDLVAIQESWAVWWALAFQTEALILSHSNFGWSAAEIGQRRAFHFATCRVADVTSP